MSDLLEVKDGRGVKRFHPADMHPAIRQLREQLERARLLAATTPGLLPGVRAQGYVRGVDFLVASMERDIAEFAQGHERAKVEYLHRQLTSAERRAHAGGWGDR